MTYSIALIKVYKKISTAHTTHYLNGECKWHYFWLLRDFKTNKQTKKYTTCDRHWKMRGWVQFTIWSLKAKKLTVNTLKAPQWRSGNGWVLILLKSSSGWLDKDVNHDSVILRRSSVCCSGYIHQKNVQKRKSLVRITNKFQVLSTCSKI